MAEEADGDAVGREMVVAVGDASVAGELGLEGDGLRVVAVEARALPRDDA